jgi:hypothetical protein
MIQAHREIFRILDDFCSARKDPVQNAAEIRYISGPTTEEKKFLQEAQCKIKLEFTATRRTILYDFENKSYFCLIGFDNSSDFSSIHEELVNGGNFTAVIADLMPKPVASTSEIRNIVEAQDKRLGASYKGHSQELIATLFPSVRIFSGEQVTEEEAYRAFFRFCLFECQFNDFWISTDLAQSLIQLCDVDSLKIPYQTLCRSIFDADPAALFLGLYRCIEALYALKTTSLLIGELSLKIDWNDMCVLLEKRLGWRAPEAASLNSLLTLGDEQDLKNVLHAIGHSSDFEMPALANAAGRQIYSLRNALVHFRPIHHKTEFERVDWNQLCRSIASLVHDIYEKIYLNQEGNDLDATEI